MRLASDPTLIRPKASESSKSFFYKKDLVEESEEGFMELLNQVSVPPNPLSYTHYASFLQAAYEYRHSSDPNFSYSYICEKVDLRSRTQVRSFIKGQVEPNFNQFQKLLLAFSLNKNDEAYLKCLFRFNKTRDSSMAYDLFEQLLEHQTRMELDFSPFREIEVACSLLHLTILSLADCVDFKIDPDWIGQRLIYDFSFEEIEDAVKELLRLGYLIFDKDLDRYKAGQSYVKKMDSSVNFFLRRFHYDCLKVAKESVDEKEMSDRFLIASTIAVPAKSLPRFRQKVSAFLDNLVRTELRSTGKTEVLQVNIQLLKVADCE